MPSSVPSPAARGTDAARGRVCASLAGAPGSALATAAPAARRRRPTARASSPNISRTISRPQLLGRRRGRSSGSIDADEPCPGAGSRSGRPSESASWSLCVMKMIAWPCSFRRASTFVELGDALRRQHRRRLVEDQHPRAAPERLDDLDLLLVAEREVGGPRRPGRPRRRAARRARARRARGRSRRPAAAGACRRASGSRAPSAPGSASSAGRPCRSRARARPAAS